MGACCSRGSIVRRHRSNSSLSLASLEVERRDNHCPLGITRQDEMTVHEFRNVEEERITNHSVVRSCSMASAVTEECGGASAEFISTRTSLQQLNPGKLGGLCGKTTNGATLVVKEGGDNPGRSDEAQCDQNEQVQGGIGGDAEVTEGNNSDDDVGKKINSSIVNRSSSSSSDAVGGNAYLCAEDLLDGKGNEGGGVGEDSVQEESCDSDWIRNCSVHRSSSSSSSDSERNNAESCGGHVLGDGSKADGSKVEEVDSGGISKADGGDNVAEYCELGKCGATEGGGTRVMEEVQISKGESGAVLVSECGNNGGINIGVGELEYGQDTAEEDEKGNNGDPQEEQ